MTTKTPEQIAEAMTDPSGDATALLRDFPDSRKAEVREAIVAAIERDRAQRDAANRYVVMVRGLGPNRDMADAEMGRFDNRFNASAVAAAWNAGNGKHGFEYWVEEES